MLSNLCIPLFLFVLGTHYLFSLSLLSSLQISPWRLHAHTSKRVMYTAGLGKRLRTREAVRGGNPITKETEKKINPTTNENTNKNQRLEKQKKRKKRRRGQPSRQDKHTHTGGARENTKSAYMHRQDDGENDDHQIVSIENQYEAHHLSLSRTRSPFRRAHTHAAVCACHTCLTSLPS